MSKNEENLNELLGRFFSEQAAAGAKEDIRAGDEILTAGADPEPEKDVIDGIKTQIAVRLTAKKRATRWMVARGVAVAALIIIVGLVWVQFTGRDAGNAGSFGATAGGLVWDDETAGNGHLASLTDEIDEIERSIYAIRFGEYGSESESVYERIEMEMIEIDNGDFWKG